MNMKIINSLSSIALISSLLTGCATSQLETKAKLTRSIILDLSQKKNNYIYLQVTNTAGSGGENMQLYQHIKRNLEAKGYKVITNSKNSSFGLFVNVLFANNLREANAIKSGASFGIAGATTAYNTGSGGKNSLLIGAAAALGGAVVGKALEDEIFRAVVDIQIREYKNTPIKTTTITTNSNAQIYNTARAGNLNQLSGPIGDKNGGADMVDNTSQTITTTAQKDYYEYKTRAFVEATKMNLKLDQALPILEAKISRQISNLF